MILRMDSAAHRDRKHYVNLAPNSVIDNEAQEFDSDDSASEDEYVVFAIQDHKYEKDAKGQLVRKYKIRWLNWGPEGDSYEPAEHLEHCSRLLDEYKKSRKLNEEEEASTDDEKLIRPSFAHNNIPASDQYVTLKDHQRKVKSQKIKRLLTNTDLFDCGFAAEAGALNSKRVSSNTEDNKTKKQHCGDRKHVGTSTSTSVVKKKRKHKKSDSLDAKANASKLDKVLIQEKDGTNSSKTSCKPSVEPKPTVVTSEKSQLNEEKAQEFGDDVLIDSYLSRLVKNILPERQERVHLFSACFWMQLTSTCEGSDQTSKAMRRHDNVRTLTENMDIFAKDFVVIPINQKRHWFLVVICYPFLTSPVLVDSAESNAGNPSSATAVKIYGASDVSSSSIMSTVKAAAGCSHSNQKQSKRPCILVFNSVQNDANLKRTSRILRDYLNVEWVTRRQTPVRIFTDENMPGIQPKVPQQEQLNSFDSALFVLQFADSFFHNLPSNFFGTLKGLKNWFATDEISAKSNELKQLLGENVVSEKQDINDIAPVKTERSNSVDSNSGEECVAMLSDLVSSFSRDEASCVPSDSTVNNFRPNARADSGVVNYQTSTIKSELAYEPNPSSFNLVQETSESCLLHVEKSIHVDLASSEVVECAARTDTPTVIPALAFASAEEIELFCSVVKAMGEEREKLLNVKLGPRNCELAPVAMSDLSPVQLLSHVIAPVQMQDMCEKYEDVSTLPSDEKLAMLIRCGDINQCLSVLQSSLTESNCNQTDDNGVNLLFLVASGKCPDENGQHIYCEISKALLAHGAFAKQITRSGFTALMCAAQTGSVCIMQHLLPNSDVNAANIKDGNTALCIAASSGHLSVVQMLLFVSDVLHENYQGQSAVDLARHEQHHEVFEFLHSFRASLWSSTIPLMWRVCSELMQLVSPLTTSHTLCAAKDVSFVKFSFRVRCNSADDELENLSALTSQLQKVKTLFVLFIVPIDYETVNNSVFVRPNFFLLEHENEIPVSHVVLNNFHETPLGDTRCVWSFSNVKPYPAVNQVKLELNGTPRDCEMRFAVQAWRTHFLP